MDSGQRRSIFKIKRPRGVRPRGRMPGLPFIEKACNSRSTARRAYDHYIKRIAAKKPAGLVD
jgi:hypothetical protein